MGNKYNFYQYLNYNMRFLINRKIIARKINRLLDGLN